MRIETWGSLTVRIAGEGEPTVVLLHGFGAPGDDLVPLAGEIDRAARFVFPAAPVRLPAEYGMGRAWWMIDIAGMQAAMLSGRARDLTRQTPEGLAPARQKLLQMLSEMREELGLGQRPIVLGGFSQGAMLACDVALRSDEPVSALALMSGTLLCEDEWLPLMSRRKLTVLMSHGRQDPLLPFSLSERLRDLLVEAGNDVRFVPFDGGHGIAPQVLSALGKLIGAQSPTGATAAH